jgi:hypothetical protein
MGGNYEKDQFDWEIKVDEEAMTQLKKDGTIEPTTRTSH